MKILVKRPDETPMEIVGISAEKSERWGNLKSCWFN